MGYVASNSSGFLNITNTKATNCVANRGGVAYVDSCSNIDLSGSEFDKNHATEAGGVVYALPCRVRKRACATASAVPLHVCMLASGTLTPSATSCALGLGVTTA